MNSKDKGNIAEAAVLLRLLQLGKTVSIPYGENARYDLVFEEQGKFYTVQCKLGRLRKDSIKFNLCSVYKIKGKLVKRSYGDSIDYYGVYSPDLHKVYLVPSREVKKREATLKLGIPKFRNQNGFRLAENFEI
jgi:hypothetical protein